METTASDFVVALDIGSHRARCLIAEITDGSMTVIGRGEEPARGVRRGEVVDIPSAGYAAHRALSAAEEQAGVEVQTLFLAVGSRHAAFFNNRACVGITREERTITARDVQGVLAAARRVPAREDAVTVGSLVSSYAVDDVRHVREPEGMHGTRIEADVYIITDARSTVDNMSSCVDGSKHEIEEFVFAPYAAGEAVLDDDGKKLGVAVIDIGAGTTGIMLYRDHTPVFTSVVPIGGDHITSDIAVGMELGLADAERLKEEHATVEAARADHSIAFERAAKAGTYCVESRRLHAVVDCRVREILDVVRRELTGAGVRPSTIRVVLTGGTSRLPGIESMAATILRCPVRIGRPVLGGGASPMPPDMATAAGMLLVGMRARRRQMPETGPVGRAGKFLCWLRQLF